MIPERFLGVSPGETCGARAQCVPVAERVLALWLDANPKPGKGAGALSLARIGAKNDNCTRCRKCERSCPMDVEIRRYVDEGKKVLSTECILCLTCTAVCPEGVLGVTLGPSLSTADYLRVRKPARREVP